MSRLSDDLKQKLRIVYAGVDGEWVDGACKELSSSRLLAQAREIETKAVEYGRIMAIQKTHYDAEQRAYLAEQERDTLRAKLFKVRVLCERYQRDSGLGPLLSTVHTCDIFTILDETEA